MLLAVERMRVEPLANETLTGDNEGHGFAQDIADDRQEDSGDIDDLQRGQDKIHGQAIHDGKETNLRLEVIDLL